MTTFTIAPDGFARDADNRLLTRFVDSFRIATLEFPQASFIGLRLYDAAEPLPRNGQPPVQVRMTARAARELAQDLLACADALEGTGAPRQ